MDLTDAEINVLRCVCDALFPSIPGGDSLDQRNASDLHMGDLLADAVQHSLQPGNASDLSRVISVFESPQYNLII